MEELFFSKIFYQFFTHAKDYTLSYAKIRQIRDELALRQSPESEPSIITRSFYLLIYLGLIDRVNINNKIAFCLTESFRISGHHRAILINCDVDAESAILPGLNYVIQQNIELPGSKRLFKATDILKEMPSVRKIVRNRFGHNQIDI